ncbi:MAG: FAD-binding oxidoreductase [Halobacteriales archaeon]|nr:FAD-binding oxidoreductase [Halobacteriales archaeon]
MDPLEMLSAPFKLTYRYSPLVRELPDGLKRELRFIFNERVTVDLAERAVAARDRGALPAALVDQVMKRKPYAVVQAGNRGDLVEALRLAERHGLPVTPRGNGTSTNGASIPSEGGIAVSMTGFDRVLSVDAYAGTATAEAGVTFDKLREALAAHKLQPLVEPELSWASTVGGSVALGRYGIGSAMHGPISAQCSSVEVIRPDRSVAQVEGDDLDLVRGMQGCTGFLTRVTLQVGPQQAYAPLLIAFDDQAKAAGAFGALLSLDPYHVSVLTADFVSLRQEASEVKGLQEKPHVLVAFPADQLAAAKPRVEALLAERGGKLLPDAQAAKEWGQRGAWVSLHRLGPTVLTAECLVPVARLAEALHALSAAARTRVCVDAFAAGQGLAMVRVHILEDERRMEFPTSLGNLYAVIDAAKELGGTCAYPSLLLATETKRTLGEHRSARLAAYKQKHDLWEVMNPGKLTPARLRGMPMAHIAMFMRTQKPLLKAVRGLAPYKGAEGERSGDVGVALAIGRAHGGAVAEFGNELYTCSFCGLCNTAVPAAGPWETQKSRGQVMAARALLEGEARWTQRLHENVFAVPLTRAGDAVCPSKIPIQAARIALRTEAANALGPLPQHEGMAALVAKEGNPMGKPKAQRGAWLPADFTPASGAKVLYYAGSRAAYERPQVALAGLELMRKVGAVNTLGAAEPDSGHELLWTGQREAAAKQAKAAMTAILKTGCEVLVTPDAQDAATMREFWPAVAAEEGIAWNVQVQHAPAYLLPLAGKGLALTSQVAEKVHFTEPCCAADASSAKLLAKVPGLQLVQLPILACGAPGGMREAMPGVAEAASTRALDQALAAGVTTLVTSNPLCEAQLGEVAARASKAVQVVDVLQLVARAAGIALPGEAPPGPAAPAAAPKPAPPKLTPEELEARKKAALEKAAAMKAQKEAAAAP